MFNESARGSGVAGVQSSSTLALDGYQRDGGKPVQQQWHADDIVRELDSMTGYTHDERAVQLAVVKQCKERELQACPMIEKCRGLMEERLHTLALLPSRSPLSTYDCAHRLLKIQSRLIGAIG